MRRRSAILEGLELLREAAPTLSLAQIITFLHIADEEDPLPLPDLQHRAMVSSVQAWRNVQALTKPQPGQAEGLVILGRWKMGAITAVRLSATGEQICQALDEIVRAARPIADPGERPARENAA